MTNERFFRGSFQERNKVIDTMKVLQNSMNE